jgi:dTDP-4-amino-4,6-dideoxygalactose transaminase
MTDMQGALGNMQMDRAPAIIEERRGIAAEFEAAFADLGWLRTPKAPDGYGHGYQSYPCLFQPDAAAAPSQVAAVNAARNDWMEALQAAGVSTRPATHAVHMLSFYAGKYNLRPEDFPNAWAANDCSISLPLFHGMTDADKAHVIDTVRATAPV